MVELPSFLEGNVVAVPTETQLSCHPPRITTVPGWQEPALPLRSGRSKNATSAVKEKRRKAAIITDPARFLAQTEILSRTEVLNCSRRGGQRALLNTSVWGASREKAAGLGGG